MKHGLKITREPRKLLRTMDYTVRDVAESHLCCGSAGTYNILQPGISERLGERKARNIEATEPDVIAAGNMGCLIQIARYTDRPVAHTVQLIDWASGGPAPMGLENFSPRSIPQADAEPAEALAETGDNAFW